MWRPMRSPIFRIRVEGSEEFMTLYTISYRNILQQNKKELGTGLSVDKFKYGMFQRSRQNVSLDEILLELCPVTRDITRIRACVLHSIDAGVSKNQDKTKAFRGRASRTVHPLKTHADNLCLSRRRRRSHFSAPRFQANGFFSGVTSHLQLRDKTDVNLRCGGNTAKSHGSCAECYITGCMSHFGLGTAGEVGRAWDTHSPRGSIGAVAKSR